jgi:hypothetical protein
MGLLAKLSSGRFYLAPYIQTLCTFTSEIQDVASVQCSPLINALDFVGSSITEFTNISIKLFRKACIQNHAAVPPERM